MITTSSASLSTGTPHIGTGHGRYKCHVCDVCYVVVVSVVGVDEIVL